ncbi:hypothetical protein EDB84DRAFT_301616 [Lactarius hengduanensis]|nr:hypothetical protein EDB84DRAFT_301616 [Lactarius hengduanensis]
MYPVSEQASVRSGKMKAHCISMLRKDADEAGVVLLVLDARDMTGARKAGRVRGGGKAARAVFVFNIIDPVPCENAQAFAKGLPPHDLPGALPFREPGSSSA